MAEMKFTQEQQDAFRNGLDAAADLAESLMPICKTTKDLVEMVRLALTNDAQFALLMRVTIGQESKK